MRRTVLLLAVCACGLLPPSSASAAPVADPGVATSVREYQGTIVFSRHVPAQGGEPAGLRLAVRRPGVPAEDLPLAPSADDFQADIGPDSNGRPQVVYRRCPDSCDLYVYSLTDGTGERAVRNANDPGHDDVEPTLWRGRIAWTRTYGEGRDRAVVVYTKTLTAPRSRPSTRLPGVPRRRCGDSDPSECGPTTGGSVAALELYGANLAQVVLYRCEGCSGIAQSELRLVRVPDRSAAQVAFHAVGLSGQTFQGPSFFAGRLAWYRSCQGDPAGCQGGRGGPMRYALSSRRYEKGTPGPVRVDGFADTGSTHFRGVGCSEETMGTSDANCRIEEGPAPRYAPAPRPGR